MFISNLGLILHRLATIHPWQTDGQTTTTTKDRPLSLRIAVGPKIDRLIDNRRIRFNSLETCNISVGSLLETVTTVILLNLFVFYCTWVHACVCVDETWRLVQYTPYSLWFLWSVTTTTRPTLLRCVPKNIPDIFDSNLKNNYQILIIFGTNIPDTTCHQTTAQLLTSPNVCFCTT